MKVLVIEGNALDSKLILDTLKEHHDYDLLDVECSESLKDGLLCLTKKSFDVALLNLELPDSTGIDTIVQFYRKAPSVPFVVLTNLEDIRLAVEAVKSGADDYLVKGRINSHSLVRTLKYAIEHKRGDLLLSIQYSITEILAGASSLEEAVPLILETLMQSFNWDMGVMWLAEPNEKVLRCSEVWYPPDANFLQFERACWKASLSPGDCLPGYVWATGKPHWVLDLKKAQHWSRYKSAAKTQLTGAIAFPVSFKNEILGIIEFVSVAVKPLDEQALNMVSAIGSLIGQFIHRIQSTRALKESEKMFRQIAENIQEAFWVAAPDLSKFYYVSPAYETMFEQACASLYAKPHLFTERIHAEDKGRVEIAIARDAANLNQEYRILRKDDSIRWILTRSFPIFDKTGKTIQVCGLTQDITDRKHITEMTLRFLETERRTAREIFEHAPAAIVRLENDFTITEVNSVFCQQFAIEAKDIVGENLFTHLPGLPEKELRATAEQEKSFCANGYSLSLTNRAKLKESYWDINIWPVKYINTESQSTVKSPNLILRLENVTERIRIAQQREEFVATLTHDLKTPLIGADRAFDLILTKELGAIDDSVFELLSMLKGSNRKMLEMIQNLLEIYRFEAGAPNLSFHKTDISPLINSCINELMPMAKSAQLTLVAEVTEGLSEIKGDSTAIVRLLMNLIGNAIKFTPAGGTVTVSGQNTGQFVEIKVKDTGPGIPLELQKNLFQRIWERGRESTYSPSTGLGLCLCRQIAEAHHGTIECQSPKGKGTIFIVKIPAWQDVNQDKTNAAFRS